MTALCFRAPSCFKRTESWLPWGDIQRAKDLRLLISSCESRLKKMRIASVSCPEKIAEEESVAQLAKEQLRSIEDRLLSAGF